VRRSFAHWTPRYVVARSRESLDHVLKPDDPWLTREAIALLDRLLRPADVACEFGAGRSTPWIARRVGRLTSVEHSRDWYERVEAMIGAAGLANVELVHRPPPLEYAAAGARSSYVAVLDGFADASLDFVLVDGAFRNECALAAIVKTKRGGLITIDNANWYLPSDSRSPNSRSVSQGPRDAVWGRFAQATRDWRRIWTSSGVTDTLILFKS